MRQKFLLFIFVVSSFPIGLKAQSYCNFIRNVRDFQDSVKIIEIQDDECEIPIMDGATFDINVYLGLFDKLKLDSVEKAHLIGAYNTSSGNLLLYATDSTFNEVEYVKETIEETLSYWDSVKAETLLQYKKEGLSAEKISKSKVRYENMERCFDREYAMIRYATDSTNRLFNNLIPEDTKEGYLQYLFFIKWENSLLFTGTLIMEKKRFFVIRRMLNIS